MRKFQALIVIFILGAAALTSQAQNRSPKPSVNHESYQLSVYFGYVDLTGHQPQVTTQIKVGALFFARNENKALDLSESGKSKSSPIYITSGVLHLSEDGKFILEHTFLEWWSPTSNFTYGSQGMQLELDKPQPVFFSGGLIHGYTMILSKVVNDKSAI